MGKPSSVEDVGCPNGHLNDKCDGFVNDTSSWFVEESANQPCKVVQGDDTSAFVEINRPIFNLEKYHDQLGAKKTGVRLKDKLLTKARKKFCTCSLTCWISVMMNLFPITKWLPKYSLKENAVADLMSGLTIGVMSIPQGMAYARLAGMPLVYGLYTNLVPTIIYVIFGTSKHAAIGTATVMSLMMGAIRYKFIPCEDCWRGFANGSTNGTNIGESAISTATPIELGTSTAFLVGVTLFFMGMIRLDVITTYLSDQIVSGFTAGAAVHIFTAQLDAVFGLHFEKSPGVGKIILDYIGLFKTIHQTNVTTLIISLIAVAFLIILKLVVNPLVQKKLKVPLPGELFVVIIGCIVSYFMNLQTKYDVKVVQNIPAKLPLSMAPRFDIMKDLLLDSIILAILTYVQAVSQAKLYAKSHNYKIDTRQEFFAYGFMNTVGSFFQCFNSGMSVSRSIVNERAGSKSQIAGLIGTTVVIVTILFLSPYLEPLPQGILAAIIIVACIDLLRQMKELRVLWKISKYDFAIYFITFIAVVVLDVSYGLLFSVIFSFFTVVVRTQCMRVVHVGQITGTDFFDEVEKFSTVEETPGIEIVQFQAPLHYANVERFKSKILKNSCEIMKNEKCSSPKRKNAISFPPPNLENEIVIPTRHLILNCYGIAYVDLMGVNSLKQIYLELKKSNINMYFAHLNGSIEKMFDKTKFFDVVPKENCFMSVQDAMIYVIDKSRNGRISREETTVDL